MKRLFVVGLVLMILLVACGGNEGMGGTTAGELVVDGVMGNLALPMPNGAVYMTITNGTASDDALIDAAVPGCGAVELHEMIMENDVMVMRQMEGNRIPIPAGETVMLQRGGLHVLPLRAAAGDRVGHRAASIEHHEQVRLHASGGHGLTSAGACSRRRSTVPP